LDEDQLRQLRVVKAAIDKNPHLADMKIGNQSWMMNPPYEKGGLEACTFEDTNGNITVVYRGTGKGEWLDNGYGMSAVETEQQKEAMEYFNRVVEDNGYAFKDITIDITGHSKGGNKSQYTTINSKYNYLIDNCYLLLQPPHLEEVVYLFLQKPRILLQ
jgi:hypothetical protein